MWRAGVNAHWPGAWTGTGTRPSMPRDSRKHLGVHHSGGPLAFAKELLSEKHGDSLLLTGARGAPGEVGFILVSSCVFGGKGGVENVAFWGALLTGRSATDVNIDSIWGVDVFLVCPILSLLAVAGAITVDNSWGETEGTFRTSQHIDREYRKDSRLSCDKTPHLRLPSLALNTSVCLMLR